MTIYIIIFALIIVEGTLLSAWSNKSVELSIGLSSKEQIMKSINPFLMLATLQITILAAIRGYTIGADTKTYVALFEYLKNSTNPLTTDLSWQYDYEIGYILLNRVIAFFRPHTSVFLTIIALIMYIPTVQFVRKYSPSPALSMVLYLGLGIYGYSLGILRQMLGVSVCLLSIDSILEQKPIRFVVFCFIAISLHTTAVIWIPMYWLSKVKFKKHYFWGILAVSGVTLLMGKYFISWVINNFLTGYTGYLQQDYESGTYLMLIATVFIFAIMCFSMESDQTDEDNFFAWAISIVIILRSAAYSVSITGRALEYYQILLVALIPRVIFQAFSDEGSRVVAVLVTMSFFILYFIYGLAGNQYLCPYVTFWM